MASKRKRFNWKARQHSRGENRTSKGENSLLMDVKEGETLSYVYLDATDSNTLVLPSKRKSFQEKDKREDSGLKRSKLNTRERKRLKKIVEAKEKKARHAAVIASLQTLALPPSEMSLLHSSSSIARNRVTAREATKFIIERQQSKLAQADTIGQASLLSGTSWRIKKGKRRKYRKLKAEKFLLSPKSSTEEPQVEEAEDEEELVRSREFTKEEETMVTEEEEDSGAEEDIIFDTAEESNHQSAIISSQERIECDGVSEGNKETIATTSSVTSTPAIYVPVNRPAHIQEARLSLPILSEEQQIMEAINENSVVVICGETGSGKTTQVPQFLYEAGYTQKGRDSRDCMIAVTQPRRIAAITMSGRVAEEMNLSNREVSYQIRHEGTVSDTTKIKFMTDGVLLKEVENDLLLSRYSAVIIDEAHERSVFTDVLIGLLSRIVLLREKKGYPLKLVIMSATLRVEDFTENRLLFPYPPPVVKVDSRQFPVTVHFNRTTPSDYVAAAFSKVCKIHRQLPEGHILVFLTGKAEIHSLCKQLRRNFPSKYQPEEEQNSTDSEEEELMRGRAKGVKRKRYTSGTKVNLDDYPVLPEDEMEADDEEDENEEDGVNDRKLPLLVLPLYSMLSTEQQAKVFQSPPAGVRLCVVATNVAETSITIPNIKFVVDSGKVKAKHYDKVTGAYTFKVGWVSKASANQRAGRAGRTSPGHCYRLYSSAVFQHQFSMFSPAEITQRPVDDLVLQMKALHIDRVVNFPFPTPPSKEALVAAEQLLVALGALRTSESSVISITPLGLTMAQFPIAPRYAKMLCIANQNGCLPYMIAIASALSVNEIFTISDSLKEENEEDEGGTQKQQLLKLAAIKRTWAGTGECQLLGDLMVLLRAVGAFECSMNKEVFCRRNCLRYKAMMEIRKLRQQLTNIVNTVCSDVSVCIDPNMAPPTAAQARFLRQIVLTGLGDHVARKISTSNMNMDDKRKMRYAYESPLCEGVVYLHPASTLLNSCPQYVVFQELLETTKQCIRGITAVEEDWFPSVLPHLCSFSQPLDLPPPSYDADTGTISCHRKCTFSSSCWPLEVQEVAYPDCLEKYKLFAQFFLQGKVVPSISQYCPYLLSAPVTMMKTWSKLHKRTEVLLSALVAREVCSQQQLLMVWRKEPKYLLKAYSMWLPESKHSQIANNWPPCSV